MTWRAISIRPYRILLIVEYSVRLPVHPRSPHLRHSVLWLGYPCFWLGYPCFCSLRRNIIYVLLIVEIPGWLPLRKVWEISLAMS